MRVRDATPDEVRIRRSRNPERDELFNRLVSEVRDGKVKTIEIGAGEKLATIRAALTKFIRSMPDARSYKVDAIQPNRLVVRTRSAAGGGAAATGRRRRGRPRSTGTGA